MTKEEKFSKLQDLFAQRAAIDTAIMDIINGKEILAETSIKAPKQRKKWTRNGNKEKRYYCLDCKEVFNSATPKLDAICPNCNSVHVDYAQRHNR
jgi:hypothetical protein